MTAYWHIDWLAIDTLAPPPQGWPRPLAVLPVGLTDLTHCFTGKVVVAVHKMRAILSQHYRAVEIRVQPYRWV